MKDTSDYAVRGSRRGRVVIALPMPDWPTTVAHDDPRLTDTSWPAEYGPGNLGKWTPEERWALEMRSYLTTRVGRYWKGIDCDKTIGPPLGVGVTWYCLKRGDRRVTDGLFAGKHLTAQPISWALRVDPRMVLRLCMADPSWVRVYTRYVAPAKSMEVRYGWLDGTRILELGEALAALGVRVRPRTMEPEDLYLIARSVALMRLKKSDDVARNSGDGKDRRKRT